MGRRAGAAARRPRRSWPSYRDPEFVAALAESSGPRHLDADMELVQDTFRAFAQNVVAPQAEHVHRTNGDVPEDVIEGLAEIGAFGLSVPAEYGGYSEGGDGEYLAMVDRHRGAQPGQPRHRRLADHPPGDPHPGPRQGRHRGAEAALAAEAGDAPR